ncbi:MAG TPA: response regulator [Ohtaekwangia sp.]|nr:response regulator [Ohtaekwangia sp.]
MYILVIDDDADDFEFFLNALKLVKPAARCQHLKSGLSALKFLQKLTEQPNLIFLNINMPKMNGTEVLIALKSDPKLKDIPVIMWSTTTSEKEKSAFKKLGAVHFLTKPTELSVLMSSLKGLVN